MLSIGKPPPDPPCACDESIPPLNSDERASPSPQLPDPIRSLSLPDFSIRNYVFAARSKDININWPFSTKSLQLCLKHGVTDPLPPFQSLDNVRNQSSPRSLAKSGSSLKKEIIRSNPTNEQLRQENVEDDTRLNDRLADNNFPSTTTSIPNSKQLNNDSASVEPETLLGNSVEKKVAGFTISCRTETALRSASKKGRLIVKPGGNLEHCSTEDIDSTSTVSETMASKVCPVCKTFSSSSNTTLNAHIDQCLSEEPTAKWSAGSKLIRHRIKPRKTRLMVDIYETAHRCTLEDLDRRNGSNWATGTSLPSIDTAKEKRQKVSVNSDGDVGAVYIDSNGTKLRILSEFTNSLPSSSRAGEALGPRKCSKGRGNKVLLSKKKRKQKKKRQNAQKHHKYLKFVSQSKDFRPDKAQLHDFQEKNHGARGVSEDTRLVLSRSQGSLQPGDNRTLKQWACSKRSVAPKKVTGNDQHPRLERSLQVAQDMLLVEHARSDADNLISDGHDSDSSGDTTSSEMIGFPVTGGESPGKRKLRTPLFYGWSDCNVEESNFPPVKRRDSQSSDSFKSTRGCAFHGSNKMIISSTTYGRSSKSSSMSPAKAMRFSRMEKKVPSVCSPRRSKLDDAKNCSTPKQSEMRLLENELDPCPTAKTTNRKSLARSFTEGFGRDTRKTSDFQELRYSDSDEGMNTESSASLVNDQSESLDGLDSVVKKGEDHEDMGEDDIGAFELQSKLGTENNDLNFSKYLDQGTPIENRRFHSQSSTEIDKGSLGHVENQSFPGIIEEDIVGGTNRPCSDVNMDLDARACKEYEVERILIPGPPGSFLPSPGAMGSEEFQGSSSLTTSRVQSSLEHQVLVDGDSSGSPISAASTVSNSAPAGSETNRAGPQVVEEKTLSGSSSGGGGTEHLVPSVASIPEPSNVGVSSEKKSIEKRPLILKNDDQPCCCQRKERGSQGMIPNYLDSQLLMRRNLGSLSSVALGKRLNRSRNTTSFHVERRPDMFPRSGAPQDSEMTRSSSVPVTSKESTDVGAKVSDRGTSISSTPSACNPVFRLMGKNLMVVNKEPDASTSPGLSQSAAGTWGDNPSSSQVSRTTGLSYGSIPISSTGYSLALGNKLKTVMEPPAAPPGMSTNWHILGYNDGTFHFPNQRLRSAVVSEPQVSRPMKEIIIIDDAPEDESMPAINIRQDGVSKERQASVAPVLFPMKTTASYDPRLAGAFPFNYPSQDPSFYSQMPISRQAGSSAVGVRWCTSPEGPGAFKLGHLVPAPSQRVHFHSPLPYSPAQKLQTPQG